MRDHVDEVNIFRRPAPAVHGVSYDLQRCLATACYPSLSLARRRRHTSQPIDGLLFRTMSHRVRTSRTCLAATALCALLAGGCVSGEAPARRPNLILISIDTLRADHLGMYGYDKPTSPRLDELAAGGTTFLNAYAHSSYTPPSQTSLLASVHPSVHGVWRHNMAASADVPMLAEILSQAGYATGALTELSATHYTRGFDSYAMLKPFAGPVAVRDNRETIGAWLGDRGEQPYFLFLHFFAVHLPLSPQPEYLERFETGEYAGRFQGDVSLPELQPIMDGEEQATPEDWTHLKAMYDAEIAEIDTFLGDLFDRMRADGSFDDTVFAIVSDHGEQYGEHGTQGHSGPMWEYIIRTPMILAGPGIPRGQTVDGRARNIDIAPTLLRLADVEPPDHYEGLDLGPLWRGEETEERVVIAEKRCCRTLVAGNWKYTIMFETGHEELFDLETDPGETTNLATSRGKIARQMRRLAREWQRRLSANRDRVRQGIEITLPEEEIKRLRALGYLQ
jgi:arylsulfatase A-like enzyme